MQATVDAVRQAGFIVHADKSVFTPTQDIQYIGFMISSLDMTVRLTGEKALGIKKQCEKLLSKRMPTIQQVSEVVGKLVAALPGILHGDLHYRLIDIDKMALSRVKCHAEHTS